MKMDIYIGHDPTLLTTLKKISHEQYDEFGWKGNSNWDFKYTSVLTSRTTVGLLRDEDGVKVSIQVDETNDKDGVWIIFRLPEEKISYTIRNGQYIFTIKNKMTKVIITVDGDWYF